MFVDCLNISTLYKHQFRSSIHVPSKFDVHVRNIDVAWRKFKRQWNNYEVAWMLNTQSPKYLTSVLIAFIGDEAFVIFDGGEGGRGLWEKISKRHWDCAGQIKYTKHFSLQKKPRGRRNSRHLYILFAEVCQDVQFQGKRGTHAQG